MIWKLLLAALFMAAPLQAQEPARFSVDKWGGINDFLPSSRLDPSDAQDAENVLTDGGKLEKFPGSVDFTSAVLAGFPIKGLWQYVSANGTKYLIIHASQTVYQTNLASAPVAIGTVSATGIIDAENAFGKIFFVDGTSSWYWDGISTAGVAGMPLCKKLEFKDERLYCGNSSVSTSRVHVSSGGGFSYWTVPADFAKVGDAPSTWDFQRDDGESVTCLKKTPWGLFVGKEHSSHFLKGYDNLTYYKVVLDPAIGCADDRLVQMVDGSLVWLSYEGTYSYSGRGAPQLISKKIENRTKAIGQLRSQRDFWRVTAQTDWELGTVTTNGPQSSWSTTISPGAIVPSSWSAIVTSSADWVAGTIPSLLSTASTFGSVQFSSAAFIIFNGDFATGSLLHWTCTAVGGGGPSCAAYSGGAAITASCGGIGPDAYFRILDGGTTMYVTTYTANTATITGQTIDLEALGISTRTLSITFQATGNGNNAVLQSTTFTAISSVSYTGSVLSDCASSGLFGFYPVDNVKVNRFFSIYQASATPQQYFSQVFDTYFSTPVGQLLTVSSSVPAGTDVLTRLSSCTGAGMTGTCRPWTAVANGEQMVDQYFRYYQFMSTFTTSVGTSTPRADSVQLVALSTGIYYSPVHFMGTDMTSWREGHFDEGQSGVVVYQVRTATYSFAVSATVPTWSNHSNHQTVTLSTGSYIQYSARSLFSSTVTLSIQSSLFEWAEGEAPPGASMVHDHRYWQCVTTSSVRNDICFVLQKNNEWTQFTSTAVGALALYDNRPLLGAGFGSSKIWKVMETGEKNFDGQAILAHWITPDFFMQDQDATLRELWFEADPSSATSLTIAYSLDKSTSYVSSTIELGRNNAFIEERVPIAAGYAKGKYLRLRISNGDSNEAPVVHRATIYVHIEPRKY